VAAYSAGLNLAWELDFWGRFKRGIESADAAYLASIANQQDAQILLTAQVADLYFAYIASLRRIDIANNNAAIQKRSYDITSKLYEHGAESELDLQQARTQYMSTVATIPQLEITLVTVRNALCALLGRPPGELPELAAPEHRLPDLDPALISEIPAQLLMRRPDIRSAAWQVAAQSAQVGIAEADLYPSVNLRGSLGWSGDSGNDSPEITSLSVGPAITWNIFDHGRIRNNVRLQDVRLQQAIEGFQGKVLQAARELDDAAITVIKTDEQAGPLAESVDAAQRSLELAQSRYQEGYSDFERVINAQRAVATQTERELLNQSSHVSAVINFYKALGGGWLETPIAELVPDPMRTTMEARINWGDLLQDPMPYEQISEPQAGKE